MKEKMTLETLKNDAFAIEQGKRYTTTQRTDWWIKTNSTNNHGYSVHDGFCAFVDEETIFVTAASAEVIEVLKANGFSAKSFYVPFSYTFAPEEPLWDEEKWNRITEEAKKLTS